jgi:hypothetical protein
MSCSSLRSIASTENVLGVIPAILKAAGHAAVALLAMASYASDQNPTELLEQADHLADSFNLSKAQPLYRQAEAGFGQVGDATGELRAKLGQLRYRVQLGHYTATRAELQRILVSRI